MYITSAATLYLQQLAEKRPRISGLNSSVFTNGGPEPSSLVEISGGRKNGKSLLLMQLVSRCLTRCDVIFLNISSKIDVQLLGRLVKNAIENTEPNATPAELEDKVDRCMDSLKIIDCFSSAQFELAIQALDQFMLLDNGRISLIAVDSLCEYYWADLEPQARLRKYTYYMNSLTHLRRICNKFYICCMYTVDSSFNKNQFASSRSILIDYKLRLDYLRSGQRTLNDKNIFINDKGVQI